MTFATPLPSRPETSPASTAVFPGDGEMARRCRALDWSATSLGAPETWSAALRVAVRTALESPLATNLWCGDDLILLYNDAYREVLGAKHPRALGRSGREVWAEIWPDIAGMFDAIRREGQATFAEDAPFVMERAGDTPGEAWFTFSLSPIRDDDGTIVAFLNVAFETTARVLAERETRAARLAAEHAEARLRGVFAQAPAFLAVLRGERHTFEFVNDAYSRLVGGRDVVGRDVAEVLPELIEQGFVNLLDRVLRTGEPFVGRETPVVLRQSDDSEELVYLDFVYQPLTAETGERIGVVAHGSNVTAAVEARREVERLLLESQEADRAKSDFLAAMSHDLRTPLNAIGGYAQLIELGVRGPVTEEMRVDLLRIQRSKSHLDRLVSDVLSFAKLGAGRIELRIASLDLAPTLATVVEMIAPQLEEKGLTLKPVALAPGLAIDADVDKLRQILINLLANSLKFTPHGGTIALEVNATNDAVAVTVRDSGIGIPEDEIERVFQPFVQAKRSLVANEHGVGLGLAISRQLARAMGGDLTAQSTVGVGSAFTLTLPRHRPSGDAA